MTSNRPKTPIPDGQKWLHERMIALKYTKARKIGICFGVASVAMQAFLTGEADLFIKRIEVLADIPVELMQKVIDRVKAINVEVLAESKKEAMEILKNQNLTDVLWEDARIQSMMREIAERRLQSSNVNELLEIPPFFEEIELLALIYLFPELFEQDKLPLIQSALPAFDILKVEKLEALNGVAQIFQHPGLYLPDELKRYLQLLKAMSENANFPISFILSAGDHAIQVGYDVTKQQWFFVNADKLNTIYVSDEDISKRINASFSANDVTVFETEVFVTNNNKDAALKLVDSLQENKDWQALHAITPQKASLLDSSQTSLLYVAAKQGHLDIVKSLIANGANINQARTNGANILSVSGAWHHLDIVDELIRNKVIINSTDQDYSILHEAAVNNFPFLKKLIENGANVNQAMSNGATPLYVAAQEGKLQTVQYLLEHGARIDMPMTAKTEVLVNYAKTKGRHSAIQEILNKKYGSFFTMPSTIKDFTPLQAAAFFGHLDVVNLLLERGVDLRKNNEGVKAIDFAKAMGHTEIAKILEKHLIFSLHKLPSRHEALEQLKEGDEPSDQIKQFFSKLDELSQQVFCLNSINQPNNHNKYDRLKQILDQAYADFSKGFEEEVILSTLGSSLSQYHKEMNNAKPTGFFSKLIPSSEDKELKDCLSAIITQILVHTPSKKLSA